MAFLLEVVGQQLNLVKSAAEAVASAVTETAKLGLAAGHAVVHGQASAVASAVMVSWSRPSRASSCSAVATELCLA
ncbi:hypothetical protein GUJ93_ZPchr0013g34109 [Zizania palustris]|uniref:Uncharacterized protein n=1 Tax=Zizania palustris TaxID=103762 RepID=A0A8J5X0E1_ZIZPA|nr:hypothetical protein GUJ93_ZPchr0013g34109 [Zizania palustris]